MAKHIKVRRDTLPVRADDGLREWREDIAVYDAGREAATREDPVARIRFMEIEAYTPEAAAAIAERLREGN